MAKAESRNQIKLTVLSASFLLRSGYRVGRASILLRFHFPTMKALLIQLVLGKHSVAFLKIRSVRVIREHF